MDKTVEELGNIVVNKLRPQFRNIARALLGEWGCDFKTTPEAAVDAAVTAMLDEKDHLIKAGVNIGIEAAELRTLYAAGITKDDLVKCGFIELGVGSHGLDVSRVLMAHQRKLRQTVPVA